MSRLKADERISIRLRELYQRYGYLPYRVSRFEEYDLYMRNKSFLTSEHVLAFSDMDGKLMALKPDITLSVVKNTKAGGGPVKVSYAETVYRVPRGELGFKEIMQAGLEMIGEVDVYAMGEVLMLAARSLAEISPRYALDIADLRLPAGILAQEALTDAQKAQLMALISDKNLHGLRALCAELGMAQKTAAQLETLVTEFGPLGETLPVFEAMNLPQACRDALCDLRALLGMMELYGVGGINLDFSVVNDMNYYNGLIFAGFIDGIPSGVLSGGRYDYLLSRMGKKGQAIGFAVYLDQIDRLLGEKAECDVDVLITYGADTPTDAVITAARKQTAAGRSVRVQRAGKADIRYRERIDLGGEGSR
ncbi:MAG: ATP phosphoribosyltransferase regulatory subunit [Clostridia bacterium]|nr:ATP phosphoribosyltransferase regulatory subunit [Clostridia bacterium]